MPSEQGRSHELTPPKLGPLPIERVAQLALRYTRVTHCCAHAMIKNGSIQPADLAAILAPHALAVQFMLVLVQSRDIPKVDHRARVPRKEAHGTSRATD